MTIALRPVEPEDTDFLRGVYAATRDDVAALPWPAEHKTAFLAMQFEAQRSDYEARFPNAEHSIILLDGEPLGRIWVDRSATEIRLLDIAILPQHRNRGTGRVLLERLIAEATGARKPLRHSVRKENTEAGRFYERLGFVVVEDFDLYVLMEWQAGPRPG